MDAATYRYDDHGNLVEKSTPDQTLLFEYDLDNQLSRVADQHNATIAAYGYDALRRRIWKEVHGQRTYFHYSDQGLIAELNEAGTLLKSYGYKPDAPWGTDPLYVREGGRNHWYLTDHLGTPQQIVAENGAVVWQAQYAVFGKAEVDAGSSVTNNLRFPGQYYDAETGLHYNWNRYYDSEAGRYTQTDPFGFEGGINLYAYTGGNPVNAVDPLGLAWKVGGGFGATVGIVHASYSISSESCCDENGKKHVRSIESVCWGMRLGVSINACNIGAGGSSVSFGGNKPGKCIGKGETGPESTFVTESYDKEFSSGVVFGASWSPSDPTKTTIIAGELGFGVTLSSKCWNSVITDVVVGCCNE